MTNESARADMLNFTRKQFQIILTIHNTQVSKTLQNNTSLQRAFEPLNDM